MTPVDRDDRFTGGDPLRFRFEDDTPRRVMPVPPEWAHRTIARPEPVRRPTEYERQQRRYGVAEGREYRTPEQTAMAKRIAGKVVIDGVCISDWLGDRGVPGDGGLCPAESVERELDRDDCGLDADGQRFTDMLAAERDGAAENALGRLTL